MQDRTIGLNCLISYALWTLGLGLWTASVIWRVRGLGSLAIIAAVGAATVTLRGLLRAHDRGIKNVLMVTQSARVEGVRPLH